MSRQRKVRPLLFLDVDGVLNVLPPPVGCARLWDHGIPAYVPRGMRARLEPLWAVYEPVWATAWMGRAHGAFRDHLDLPAESWPYLRWQRLKLPEIVRYAKGRPWAWVDDDGRWELDQLHAAFRDLPNTYMVTPDSGEGITDEQVDALVSFAAWVTAEDAA